MFFLLDLCNNLVSMSLFVYSYGEANLLVIVETVSNGICDWTCLVIAAVLQWYAMSNAV